VVSRSLERFLEDAAIVGPRYVLEVSSPGLERPLRWPEHWRRFVGGRARIRSRALPGRPTVEILEVPSDAEVRLRLPDGTERLVPLAVIDDATLVIDWSTYRKPT
jgi:ribosome maturation factor RimP